MRTKNVEVAGVLGILSCNRYVRPIDDKRKEGSPPEASRGKTTKK